MTQLTIASPVQPPAAENSRSNKSVNNTADTLPVRRLGVVEAAAATAVIVTCLCALAMMTGVLPAPFTARPLIQHIAPVSILPLASQPPLPSSTVMDKSIPLQASLDASETVPTIAESENQALAIQNTDAAKLQQAPIAPLEPTMTLDHKLASTTVPSAEGAIKKPSHHHALSKPQRLRHHVSARQQNLHHYPVGKTRRQVRTELMQAKRDGSYPADTYR